MSLAEPQLQHLLKRLEAESGMRRKVRLLAGSWSVLQELSPQQRERVALAVGNQWAWRNIEGLFGNPKELSANERQVKDFFESLRFRDPAELRRVGREVREGEFGGARSRVMDALEDALEEETDAEDESQAPVEAVPEPRPPAPAAPPEAPAPVIEVEASEPEPPEPELEQEVEPEPKPEPEQEPEDSVVELTPVEDTPFVGYQEEAAVLSAVESLRVLRRLSDGRVSSTPAGRAAMVGGLGSGWAARRAVTAIIRSHSVDDLGEALALIRGLPTAAQQIWCLGDLVQFWDLDDDERSRVLAAAPTESARRRLAHRERLAVDHPC
jgi:hypothetical protein